MICPNCKNESNGARWCPQCGIQLEIDDAANAIYSNDEPKDNTESRFDTMSVPREFIGADEQYEAKDMPSTDKKLKITLAIICPIAAIVLIFVILTISGVIKSGGKKVSAPEENVVLENEDAETLMKTGMNQLKIGDYEEAETVFKAVMEIDPDNEEATVLCQIVYNYNRALKKIQGKKYKEARALFDKIPIEYMDYSIRTDVENLEDEINSFETAYITFEDVQNFMRDGEYESALEAIDLIDDSYLEDSDAMLISEYRTQIKQYLTKEEEKQKEKENEAGKLSFDLAEILVTEYCEDYVRAINSKDFSVVAKHISGQLYNDQKKQVQSCIDSGITQSLDYVELNDVHKISDTKWKADVSEGETIYYADGSSEAKKFNWTYTIEYIDSAFYLTKIE